MCACSVSRCFCYRRPQTGGIRVCVCERVGHVGGDRYGLACVTAGAERWRLFV